MKVLHVGVGNLFGGIEALLVTQARFARLAPGLQQEFAVCFGGRLEDDLRAAGATVHRYDPMRLRYPWTVLRSRRGFGRLLDSARPDVVIAHSNWPNAAIGPAVKRRGIPLAFWLHDPYDPAYGVCRKSAKVRPDVAVANSRFNGERSLPRQFPGVPWQVNISASPPPSPGERGPARARVRRELGTPDDAVVIVQTSRLERWKGHEQHLAAAALLRDVPGWEVWFCGGTQRPAERAFLEELMARSEAEGIAPRVRFLGQRSDVADVISAADIHCQPNLEPEPLGLTFVEALYGGLPSVSMDWGGAAEIITPQCGVLVPPGDVPALAAALRSLIEDPAARARLGEAGPARAAELSEPGRHLERLRRILEPFAAAAAAGGPAR
jgi:glycosyltransferase involved in cell wall biosynthesis